MLFRSVTWYITCQSFLLTVYAITYSNSKQPNWFSNLLLPCLAIIVSILSYFMIQGATRTIDMWGELRISLIKKSAELNHDSGLNSVIIPRWRSDAPNEDSIHLTALWFPQCITFIFAITWCVIAIFSWTFPWLKPPIDKIL